MSTTCVHINERITGTAYQGTPVDTLAGSFVKAFNDLAGHYTTWRRRIETRQHLLDLDDRLLRDIGISRYDAKKEAAKPFWRQ
jgi:uncharacterized protein YjiS (DUF1127 family)